MADEQEEPVRRSTDRWIDMLRTQNGADVSPRRDFGDMPPWVPEYYDPADRPQITPPVYDYSGIDYTPMTPEQYAAFQDRFAQMQDFYARVNIEPLPAYMQNNLNRDAYLNARAAFVNFNDIEEEPTLGDEIDDILSSIVPAEGQGTDCANLSDVYSGAFASAAAPYTGIPIVVPPEVSQLQPLAATQENSLAQELRTVLDIDGNGTIDREDLYLSRVTTFTTEQARTSTDTLINALDADGNGSLSADEVRAGAIALGIEETRFINNMGGILQRAGVDLNRADTSNEQHTVGDLAVAMTNFSKERTDQEQGLA